MKYILTFALTALLIVFFISCKKDLQAADKAHSAILQKWKIVNDSTFTGVGINNHLINYTGQAGDYFDFRTDGYVYIKESSVSDTLSYNLTSDTTILITSFDLMFNGVSENNYITNLTMHSATISTPVAITPGGVFWRKVNLTR